MKPGKLLLLLLLLPLCLSSCIFSKPRPVERSFYYWKSDFTLNSQEVRTLQNLNIRRMYIKFFDVNWEGDPQPVASVQFSSKPPAFLDIIPTVFITNETLINLPTDQVPDLADKIGQKIFRMIAANALQRVPEIQLDCDWTTGTRAKYFELLRLIHTRLTQRKMRLSATIRLHQVKYRSQTGVPPVNCGMLMYYNMTPVNSYTTKNSILDPEVGRSYIGSLATYPLALDVALPIFSWGVVFQDRHYIGLANGFTGDDVLNRTAFEETPDHYFRVKNDIYMHEMQLYKYDLLRIEEGSYRECMASARDITHVLRAEPKLAVALFYFDSENVRRFGDAHIQNLFNRFR